MVLRVVCLFVRWVDTGWWFIIIIIYLFFEVAFSALWRFRFLENKAQCCFSIWCVVVCSDSQRENPGEKKKKKKKKEESKRKKKKPAHRKWHDGTERRAIGRECVKRREKEKRRKERE